MIPISIKGDLKEYNAFIEDFKKRLGEFIAKGYIGNRKNLRKDEILECYDRLTLTQQSLYLRNVDRGFKNIDDLKSAKSENLMAPSSIICEKGLSLLKKLEKDLDRIASANVDELIAFIDEYQKEFPTVMVKGKPVIDDKSNIYESVYKIFVDRGYEKDGFKDIVWKASKVKVCPYCNRTYIPFIPIQSKEASIKGQLDHFFPKDKYPYLAISLYNLVPSCTYCNGSSSKGDKDPLDEKIVSPFSIESHTGLRFFIERFNEDIVDLDKCAESIELGIDVVEYPEMANNERIFHLKNVYSAHRDIAADIIAKFREWSPKPYIDSIEDLLCSWEHPTDKIAVERRLRMYWGVPLAEDRLGERPMSKFTLDLINDLIKKSKSHMNTKKNIPFSPPDVTEDEALQVAEALKSGWITTGPKTKEFEHIISKYCNTDRYDADGKPLPTTVCLNSATAAMELALRVLGIGEGDEVIVPAYTYTATASCVCHVGARPVMVDCAPGSFEMDYDRLTDAITEKTKAVMPVDLGGIVADYDKVFAAVESRKDLFRPDNDIQKAFGRCIVIADAAHAFGAMWHGRMCGDIADFTSFSFHAVKNLTTAEGGALTWRAHEGVDDTTVYKKLQLLSLHGQNKDALAKTKLGGWEYDIIGTWYKCNMTDIMAGIGLAQFHRYPQMLHRRRQLIERYNVALEPLGVKVLPHYGNDHSSSGHLYLTRIPDITVEQRNDIIVKMAERGIATNVHYKPLPMMTAYRALGYDIKDFPNAYEQYHNEITLPLHTRLSDEDVEYILSNFIEIINSL